MVRCRGWSVIAGVAMLACVAGCATSATPGVAPSQDGSSMPVSSSPSSAPDSSAPIVSSPPTLLDASPPPTTNAARSADTRQVIGGLVASFATLLPPGATPLSTTLLAAEPIKEIGTDPFGGEDPTTFVGVVAHWWSLPQPQAAVLAYVAAHAPPGLPERPGGGVIGTGFHADIRAWQARATDFYKPPLVEVLAVTFQGQTSVRISAFTWWRVVRTPGETLSPRTIRGATAVSAPGGDYLGATMQLNQTQAGQLVDLLNGLDTHFADIGCYPADPIYTVTFEPGGQKAAIAGGCVTISDQSGTPQPRLTDDAPPGQRSTVDSFLDHIFGRQIGCSSADILPASCPPFQTGNGS